ncbi:TetR/AcrR family transcriptional regulator [Epibacterium ulvae]|uniref:TetR/AcrR family transcriptional regulator n=1 Tax=Epibacterium ulvae TaxID=1156985 RepID=UPI001BFC8FD9|nr:TetR/AcrR family transcriptional regulator [Epibacterium ulvae]MBT8155744.1 TetR/AcrR family transcriptional regulator [Epibacterium ulvae]
MAQRHDRAEALRKALVLFWEKGFHGTSIKDLEHHLSMHPGSIYAAFGSKAGLYCRALELYADDLIAAQAGYLQQADPVLSGLATALSNCHPAAQNTGSLAACFISKSLMETGIDDPEVQATQARLALSFEDQFTEVFDRAKTAGELPEDADCRSLAQGLQVALAGISAFALRPNRHDAVKRMMAQLCGDIKDLASDRRLGGLRV